MQLRDWSGPDHDVYFVGDPDALEALDLDRPGLGGFVRVGEIRLPGTDAAAGTGRSGGRPDFRIWIPRPPLEVHRFTPAGQ